jgi:hypothetical protein
MKHHVDPKISAESVILPILVAEYNKAITNDTGRILYLTGYFVFKNVPPKSPKRNKRRKK